MILEWAVLPMALFLKSNFKYIQISFKTFILMTDSIKKYCSIHHFYYSGEECPFCASDRVQALSRKFNKDKIEYKPKKDSVKKEKNKSNDKEITQTDLEKLKNKFNVKKH